MKLPAIVGLRVVAEYRNRTLLRPAKFDTDEDDILYRAEMPEVRL